MKTMEPDQISERKIATWQSSDPAWPWYAVAEPNHDTQWFRTAEEARVYAATRARITHSVIVHR
jgi:hypothetical protein